MKAGTEIKMPFHTSCHLIDKHVELNVVADLPVRQCKERSALDAYLRDNYPNLNKYKQRIPSICTGCIEYLSLNKPELFPTKVDKSDHGYSVNSFNKDSEEPVCKKSRPATTATSTATSTAACSVESQTT